MGIYNANTILERIQRLVYTGGITIVKDYMNPLRPPAIRNGTSKAKAGTNVTPQQLPEALTNGVANS